jgi:hypothetical protein
METKTIEYLITGSKQENGVVLRGLVWNGKDRPETRRDALPVGAVRAEVEALLRERPQTPFHEAGAGLRLRLHGRWKAWSGTWIFIFSRMERLASPVPEGALAKCRATVERGVAAALQRDCCHKSYEGRIEAVTVLPNVFEDDQRPKYLVRLDCYVMGPNRHYEWEGYESLDAVLATATAVVEGWITEAEEEAETEEKANRAGFGETM